MDLQPFQLDRIRWPHITSAFGSVIRVQGAMGKERAQAKKGGKAGEN